MSAELEQKSSEAPTSSSRNSSCPVGGCGSGKGMCPGIALAIGLIVGTVASALTGLQWLTIPVTIVLGVLLILGFYPTGGNWPFRSTAQKQ